MTLVYVDSSTLLKRVLDEPEGRGVRARLARMADEGHDFVSSALAWLEVGRALRQVDAAGTPVPGDSFDAALAGVGERPMTPDLLSLARRIGPPTLRSLDAIHLATAVLVDADLLMTHDHRLAAAAVQLDFVVE